MPLTSKQLEAKSKSVGASQTASICGLSPYPPTALELWCEFTGKAERRNTPNPQMVAGLLLEDSVLEWYVQTTGHKITRARSERRVPGTPILVHRDATVVGTDEVIEAKTSGVYGPVYGLWGDEGTDQIPHHYVVQCMTHLAASKADVVHVPVLLCGWGFRCYHVWREPKLIQWIIDQVGEFWDCVLADRPPPDTKPIRLEVLKRMKRVPKSVAEVDPDLLRTYRMANLERMRAEEVEEEAQARLIEAGGDAEQFIGNGQGSATYFEYTRTSLDSKALRAAHPDIAKKFSKSSRYRRLAYKDPD